MAEQHGDALGAHVRGKPGLALRKLRRVAQVAPSAPQIYSSLGMVYEDMLLQAKQQNLRKDDTIIDDAAAAKDSS